MQQRPDFTVFISRQVVNGDQETKNYFTEVGTAWHIDGDGISINLIAVPTDGKLVLFPTQVKATPKITPSGSGFTFD
jgi:hypothetical protein